MITNTSLAVIAAMVFLTAAANPAKAAIVLSGNFNTGDPTPTLTITQDIVFEITSSGFVIVMVFQDWTTSDGTHTGVDPAFAQSFAYDLNGTVVAGTLSGLYDNVGVPQIVMMPNDGYMGFGGISVQNGDTFTVLAGTYNYNSDAEFNPLLNGVTFTGNAFIAGFFGDPHSNFVAVPEPSSALLFGALVIPAFFRRKRSN